MGGLVCMVGRQAVLEFQSVPTDASQLPEFDAQIRSLYSRDYIADSLVNDAPDKVKAVCDILAKPSFTQQDRELLYSVVESLYKPYA